MFIPIYGGEAGLCHPGKLNLDFWCCQPCAVRWLYWRLGLVIYDLWPQGKLAMAGKHAHSQHPRQKPGSYVPCCPWLVLVWLWFPLSPANWTYRGFLFYVSKIQVSPFSVLEHTESSHLSAAYSWQVCEHLNNLQGLSQIWCYHFTDTEKICPSFEWCSLSLNLGQFV